MSIIDTCASVDIVLRAKPDSSFQSLIQAAKENYQHEAEREACRFVSWQGTGARLKGYSSAELPRSVGRKLLASERLSCQRTLSGEPWNRFADYFRTSYAGRWALNVSVSTVLPSPFG
jgi:hypothetical protein